MIEHDKSRACSKHFLICLIHPKEQRFHVSLPFFQKLFSEFGAVRQITVFGSSERPQLAVEFVFESAVDEVIARIGQKEWHFGNLTAYKPSEQQLFNIFGSQARFKSTKMDLQEESHSYRQIDQNGNSNRLLPNQQEVCQLKTEKTFEPLKSQTLDGPSSTRRWFLPSLQENSPFAQFSNFLRPASDSGLIFIENLATKKITHKILMNLFCCFGNVEKLIVSPETGTAVVQYPTIFEVKEVLKSLQKKEFFGSILRLHSCDDLRLEFSRKKAYEMKPLLALHGDSRLFRFQEALNIRFNRPTNTLHFTNIDPACDKVILFMLLSQVHEPLSVTQLGLKGNNGSFMYLAKFESIDQAIEVLSVLHNKAIQGKSLKVSFSRPRQ